VNDSPARQASAAAAGQAAEQAALDYLIRQGLKPVQRNFHCRFGEIDLIMQSGATLVFVEVRKRTSSRYGGAAASITASKQARLIKAAQVYLQQYAHPPACRFDALAFEGEKIIWLQNVIES